MPVPGLVILIQQLLSSSFSGMACSDKAEDPRLNLKVVALENILDSESIWTSLGTK